MKKRDIFSYFFFLIVLLSLSQDLFSQNTGVGTITPAEKLHVAGNIKANTVIPVAIKLTNNAGAGKILTSDAGGNASWRTGVGGSVGFGSWGDCSTASISEYNPVVDATGATDDRFGNAVSISGNYAIVGANQDDVGSNGNQGSASIYQFNGSNWVLMQKITDATGATGDQFGVSVSISGNYAIVGAFSDDGVAGADQGSVNIYQLSGGNWVLMNKIFDATGAVSDFFGVSVSISGNYAIVGAFRDDGVAGPNQGSVSIYQFSGGNWVLMNKIFDATGATDDEFGSSVSISGNYAITGAHYDDVGLFNQGSASIYQLSGGIWILMNKISDALGPTSAEFGCSVSISGNYAIIGALAEGSNVGSASIFEYNGSNWVLGKKLFNPTGLGGSYFGYSVAISGNYAMVGSGSIGHVGFCQIYLKLGLGWQRLQYITEPGNNGGAGFGSATSIDAGNKRFVVGAIYYMSERGKAVFGKIN